jgi:hypothetical protein
LAALIICLATLIYQVSERSILNKEQVVLEKELALNSPILSKDKVSKMADEVKAQKKIIHQYVQRYLGLAAIGEVSDLTPQSISLISFKIVEGSVSSGTNADKTRPETSDGVTIEGVIFGDRNMLDSLLAQYVMKLGNSPMLSKVSIQKNNFVTFKKSEVLQFTLSAKIG